MAHILRLVSDAFSTISFVDANKSLGSFNPKAGLPGGTVTNTIEFWFEEASNPNFQTAKQAIERALRFAEFRFDNKRGDRVYMEFQPENYTVAYRTELTKPDPESLCGNVAVPDNTLGWPWGELKMRARLIFTHKSEWEASSEAELELGVGGDAAAIGGVALRNFHTAAAFSDATVSFTQAGNIIADSGAGFGIFKVGQEISVRGSDLDNDGVFTVLTVAAGQITTNEPITADEAADKITNGTFDADANWDKGVGWTIPTPTADCDGSQVGNTDLDQDGVLVDGHNYEITFTVSDYTAGNVTPYCGTGTAGTPRAANGTFVETLVCAGSLDFILRGDVDFDGKIDDVIVKVVITIYEYLNYADIDNAQIAGDLPSAIRMEFDNGNAAPSLETVWIGMNHSASPLALAHILELEDSDTGADVDDAAASSAQKRSYTVTNTNAKATAWTLTSEQLTAADGLFFRMMARFADATDIDNVKWQLRVYRSTSIIWQGAQVQFDDTFVTVTHLIRELDTVQLPPFVPENSAPTDLTLQLWGQSTTGGNVTIVIDSLIMMALDGWRVLRSQVGVVQNAVLIDDGITETYYQEISSEQVRDIVIQGENLMLWPNRDHRLYFLFHSLTNDIAEIDRTVTLSIFYKARRLTF